ncbi:MAG: sugar phosphate nucleotidyltransferase, partial [bacterium]|nr:sugar phosphate nucleotidyltransferase [bacterium]
GAQEVPLSEVVRYGMVKLKEGTNQLEDIIEKPSIESTPSKLATPGRYILNQEIINILKETPLGKGNELWVVDAIREYVRRGGVFMAKEIKNGEWLTTGDPLNYLKATLAYAFEREDIGKDIKKYINTLLCK